VNTTRVFYRNAKEIYLPRTQKEQHVVKNSSENLSFLNTQMLVYLVSTNNDTVMKKCFKCSAT